MFSLALTISTSIFIKLLKLTLRMYFSREKNDVYVFLFLCVFIALKLVQVSHKLRNSLQLSHLTNAKSKYEKKKKKKKKLALKNKIVSDRGKRWSKSTMTSTAPGYPAQSPFRLYFKLFCTYFYVIPVIMISKVALSAITSSYQMHFSISHFSFQKKKKKTLCGSFRRGSHRVSHSNQPVFLPKSGPRSSLSYFLSDVPKFYFLK